MENVEGENFDELGNNRQNHQYFPPPKFCAIRYATPSSLTIWREVLLNKTVKLFALLIDSQIYSLSDNTSHFDAKQPFLQYTAMCARPVLKLIVS